MRYDHQKTLIHFGARYCADCQGDRFTVTPSGKAIDCGTCRETGLYAEEMRTQFLGRRHTIQRRRQQLAA